MGREEDLAAAGVCISSFLWVIACDGDVASVEMSELIRHMHKTSFGQRLKDHDIAQILDEILAVYAESYEAGVEITKQRIQNNQSLTVADEVVKCVRHAAVSDGKVTTEEEDVLKEIAKLMGVDAI